MITIEGVDVNPVLNEESVKRTIDHLTKLLGFLEQYGYKRQDDIACLNTAIDTCKAYCNEHFSGDAYA